MLINKTKEPYVNKQLDAVPIEGTKKILTPMENCIFINKKNGKFGTGFYCNIQFCRKPIPFLITNNHILNKNEIENDKIIEFKVNNELRKIRIDKNRKKYTNDKKRCNNYRNKTRWR